MLSWLVGGPHNDVLITARSMCKVERGYRPTDTFVVDGHGVLVARIWQFSGSPLNTVVVAPCGYEIQHKEEKKELDMTQDLEGRRKDLKLSRAALAEASGLSQAKIARIEKGGARTTDEEVATLTAALDKYAAEAGVGAADPS